MNRPAAGSGEDPALLSRLHAELARRGTTSAIELAAALGRSQPTVSRLLAALAPAPLVLGRARRTRYALPAAIQGAAAQQPLHWVHEDGRIEHWGTLNFGVGSLVQVRAGDAEWLSTGQLPWFLAPLRTEGFLGRLLARSLATQGLGGDPERWSLEHQLYAALLTPDPPGALLLGEPRRAATLEAADGDYDRFADALTRELPAGSSAGGEQAKFLARRQADGAEVLVKFTPPRGTPFGERWHDLLHLEALAQQWLAEHGVPTAATRVIESPRRTFLESTRFDRLGPPGHRGRRHVVAFSAVHEAFVAEPRRHWAATADALVQQGRLPTAAAIQVRALMQFGRLIGNTDMHFGNLSVTVAANDVAAGRFQLAPLYDMLPMRWRPDTMSGDLGLSPFEPEPIDLQSPAQPLAHAFWQRASVHARLSTGMRGLAADMARRTAAPGA